MIFEIGKKMKNLLVIKLLAITCSSPCFPQLQIKSEQQDLEAFITLSNQRFRCLRLVLQCRRNAESPVPAAGRGYQGGGRLGAQGFPQEPGSTWEMLMITFKNYKPNLSPTSALWLLEISLNAAS